MGADLEADALLAVLKAFPGAKVVKTSPRVKRAVEKMIGRPISKSPPAGS